jgi:hypothetical protein
LATFNINFKKKTFGDLKIEKTPKFCHFEIKIQHLANFRKKKEKSLVDNFMNLDDPSLLLEKNSPHNLLSGFSDLGYFWGKKNPHNLFSNLCDVIYFWKKFSPQPPA